MSFTVYKSSAGSGKTFTLVKEYLKIILRQPSDFRSILAITFTNKAANEMKDRVISNLKELAAEKPHPDSKVIKYLLPDLIKETGLSSVEIQQNAKKSLALILHHYSDFAISTIDSFVHKIVKTFAYDLKLPLNFEVELDADLLLNEAIDILISRVGVDDELTDLMIRFTESKTDEESDWHIEKDLFNLSKTLMKEDAQDYLDRLKVLSYEDYKNVLNRLGKFVNAFKKQVSELAKSAVEKIEQHQINIDSFARGNSGIGKYFLRLSDARNEDYSENSYVRATIENDKWAKSGIDEAEKASIEQISSALKSIYFEIQEVLESRLKQFKLYRILQGQVYPIAVLGEIEKIVSDIKEQNSIVHISEFNKQISGIVFSEPIPFIYERLGERYKHFLIDEFQDTSVLQWQNMIPLLDNSLAEGHFNMIVGDGKQSIYRWRDGEVEQFARLPEIYKKEKLPLADERELTLKRNYREKILENNFRSKREVIEFNNEFFKSISSYLNENFTGIYDSVEQLFDEQNTGGCVQIEFVDKSEENATLQSLRSIIEALSGKGRKLSELAILCRTKNEAQKCSAFLLEHKIPVLSSESLLLSSSNEINLLVSFLNFLLQPANKINIGAVIQYLIDKNQIFETTLVEAFDAIRKLRPHGHLSLHTIQEYLSVNGFEFNAFRLLSLPVYDLTEELIRLFKLNTSIDPYLQFFLDAVLRFSLKGKTGISEFLDWWELEKTKESVIIPEGIEAVQVMTIHKSKGLEFPIVIYPYANERVKSGVNHFWVELEDENISPLKVANIPVNSKLEETEFGDEYAYEMEKSLLDLINLLYVAFTRPVEQLYVIADDPPKSKNAKLAIPSLLKFYLQQVGEWEDGKRVYFFGSDVNMSPDKLPESQQFQLQNLFSVNWRDNLMISTSAPDLWDMDEPDRNKSRGNLLHLLLSQINRREDILVVVSKNVEKGIVEPDQQESIVKLLTDIVEHPEVEPYFKAGLSVKTEPEILLESGLTIRPDRLVFADEKIIIIDYKTGKPSGSHKKQLDRYAQELRGMSDAEIQKVLIYIEDEIKLEKWS